MFYKLGLLLISIVILSLILQKNRAFNNWQKQMIQENFETQTVTDDRKLRVLLESGGKRQQDGSDKDVDIRVSINDVQLYGPNSERASGNGINLVTVTDSGVIREIDSFDTNAEFEQSDRLLNKLILLGKQQMDRFIILIVKGDAYKNLSDELRLYMQDAFDAYKLADLPYNGSYIFMYDYKRQSTIIEEMIPAGTIKIEQTIPYDGEYRYGTALKVNAKIPFNFDAIYYDKRANGNFFVIFMGDTYTEYNITDNVISKPKKVKDIANIRSKFVDGVDAVAKIKDTVYYFRKDSYLNGTTGVEANIDTLRLQGDEFRRGSFDAVIPMPDGYVYFFKADKYVRYSWPTDSSAQGISSVPIRLYASESQVVLDKIFKTGFFEAGCWSGKSNTMFLFKEEKMIEYDMTTKRLVREGTVYDIMPNLVKPYTNSLQNCIALNKLKDISSMSSEEREFWIREYYTVCKQIDEDDYQTKMLTNERSLNYIRDIIEQKKKSVEKLLSDSKTEEEKITEINESISRIKKEMDAIKLKGCPKDEKCDLNGKAAKPSKCDLSVIARLLNDSEFTKNLFPDKVKLLKEKLKNHGTIGDFDIRTHKDYHKYMRLEDIKPCDANPSIGPNIPGGYNISAHPLIREKYIRKSSVPKIEIPESITKVKNWDKLFIHKSNIPTIKTAADFEPENHPEFQKYMKNKANELVVNN